MISIDNAKSYSLTKLVEDTLKLKEATIHHTKVLHHSSSQEFGGVSLFQSLLAQNSSLGLRSYGPSGIGSISFRAMPSAQVTMSYNGIVINSPLLGQVDVNQFALSCERYSIGVGSSGEGSSRQTGANVSLRTEFSGRDHLSIHLGGGTFGIMKGGASVEQRVSRRLAGLLSVNASRSDNDYPVLQEDPNPRLPQTQGNAQASYGSGEAGLRFTDSAMGLTSDCFTLLSRSRRYLPLALSQFTSKERLDNEMLVVSAKHRLNRPLFAVEVLHGLFLDNNCYQYPSGTESSRYAAMALPFELKVAHNIELRTDVMLNVALSPSYRYEQGWGSAYTTKLHQDAASLPIGVELVYPKLKLSFQGGPSWLRGAPFASYQASLERPMRLHNTDFGFEVKLQRLLKQPTLNDRFYPGLGIASITPDQGHLLELSTSWQALIGNSTFTVRATGHRMDYESIVQWMPEGNVWQPRVLENVAGAGLQLACQLSFLVGGYQFALSDQSSYARFGKRVDGLSIGTQTLYSPVWRHQLGLSIRRTNLGMNLSSGYHGERNTDTEGHIVLPSFWLFTAELDYTLSLPHAATLRLSGSGTLASNPDYQWILNYAAPSYQASLSVHYTYGSGR